MLESTTLHDAIQRSVSHDEIVQITHWDNLESLMEDIFCDVDCCYDYTETNDGCIDIWGYSADGHDTMIWRLLVKLVDGHQPENDSDPTYTRGILCEV